MRNLFWGIILICLGTLLLLDNLGIADFGDIVSEFWPLLLVLWGLNILIRRRNTSPESSQSQFQPQAQSPATSAVTFTMAQSVEGELVHQSNVFGDLFLTIASPNFKGGSVSAVFGDIDIDLSKAIVAEGDHALQVHSVFGDTRIILPPAEAIAISASSTFGNMMALGQFKDGFSSSLNTTTPGYDAATKRLKMNVTKVFGNLRVS